MSEILISKLKNGKISSSNVFGWDKYSYKSFNRPKIAPKIDHEDSSFSDNTPSFGEFSQINENESRSSDEELVSINGYKGVLVNRNEINSFRGPIPLSEYPINEDPNPMIIRKTISQPYNATQEIAIRYLEPPPIPPPGDLIIQQEVATIHFKRSGFETIKLNLYSLQLFHPQDRQSFYALTRRAVKMMRDL